MKKPSHQAILMTAPRCRPVGLLHRKSRGGATVVEFAIVTPLVFMLAFSAIEFARVMMIRHSIDNAVYEATRLAVIPGATAQQARAETERLLRAIGVRTAIIEVSPATITADTPRVTVRVSVPLDANSYIPQQFFAGKTLRRELSLRREGH
jgi:Flp pilus assembly protein TadG